MSEGRDKDSGYLRMAEGEIRWRGFSSSTYPHISGNTSSILSPLDMLKAAVVFTPSVQDVARQAYHVLADLRFGRSAACRDFSSPYIE